MPIELIMDGWTMAVASTMLSGSILLLIIARNVENQRCYEMGRLRWMLWICPKTINRFSLLDILFSIAFEILFMGEVILALYLYITSGIYATDWGGYFCGMVMYLYTFVSIIYIVIFTFYGSRKNETVIHSRKFNTGQIENMTKIKIGGGGLFKQLLKGILVFSILIFVNYLKKFFWAIMNGQGAIRILPIMIITFIFIIWLILITNGRVKAMVVDKKEVVYINWYGKKTRCAINEIQKIEKHPCYIFLWKNSELFAKFNSYTEGIEKILEEDKGGPFVETLKHISIRGRMAYLICSFEKLLLHYNCDKEGGRIVLEKLWAYTSAEYLDDWMYEVAEYMPNSILEDTMEDAEYITENEFKYLHELYSSSPQDVHLFLQIIFECGTCEVYSRLRNNSLNTLKKVDEAINVLKMNGVVLIDITPFMKYKYSECDGWGERFDGKKISIIL